MNYQQSSLGSELTVSILNFPVVHLPWGPCKIWKNLWGLKKYLTKRRRRMLTPRGGCINGCMGWWMDTSQGGWQGWIAVCNGGERRAEKAKWIMGMLETDEMRWDGAAYLLLPVLLLLLLCLLRGLRSAEGACEPRCLHPPSPPTRIGNKLRLYGSPLPGPSPLITLAPWIRYVSPRPHPHRLNKPARSWIFSCCDSSSAPHSPAPCVRFTPRRKSLAVFFFVLPPYTVVSWACSSLPSSPGVSFQCGKHPWSTHVYLELSALEGRDRSGDSNKRAAGPLRYQEAAVQYHCSEGENKNKKQYPLLPLRPVTAKTCSLTHKGKNKNNWSPIFLSFFPFSWIFSYIPYWTDPCRVFPCGKTEQNTRGRLAGRHRYTDGPPPRHCIIAGASHVTQLDTRVAFMGCGWKKPHSPHTKTYTHACTHNYTHKNPHYYAPSLNVCIVWFQPYHVIITIIIACSTCS